ncbi:leishmanolysin-related zinc metalloendopeptidase [Pelagibius marinus]|uniref:leishmanolysin-related zinc metalloendopeptidase n=1 Tax=Pelagibius marinus TaxID=2762760 RepID=UPI0018732C10|nr:leishmanolysin-related zinc metalloendopeptidase [Pelagibius marinus]
MAIQPTLIPDYDTTTDAAPAEGLTPPGVAVAPLQNDLPAAVSVEGQLRMLRVLDADTVVVVEPDGEVPAELTPGDAVVFEAEPLFPLLEPVDDVLNFAANAVAEAQSHAAPAPLTQPGEVIELLSGTEALAAIDGLAPFELPEGYQDDGFVPPIPHSEFAPAFAENTTAGGDLLFLDFTSFVKPDNPGGGGGGGGNGGGKGGKNGGDDTVGGGDPVDPNLLTEYLSGDPGGYNILVEFDGSDWTVDLQNAFIWAADWISSVITDDIQDVFYRGDIIDDILISATLTYIDGEGFILGQAGPTAIRTDGYLPAVGIMEFDSADAQSYYDDGLWDDIVFHEMMHTIGFGTIWDFLGLVSGSGTGDPTFTGENAMLAYADLIGSADPLGVPLETIGGAGTVESHWAEADFGNEIMTGYINDVNYTSDLTVASLSDLGYVITEDPWVDPVLAIA